MRFIRYIGMGNNNASASAAALGGAAASAVASGGAAAAAAAASGGAAAAAAASGGAAASTAASSNVILPYVNPTYARVYSNIVPRQGNMLIPVYNYQQRHGVYHQKQQQCYGYAQQQQHQSVMIQQQQLYPTESPQQWHPNEYARQQVQQQQKANQEQLLRQILQRIENKEQQRNDYNQSQLRRIDQLERDKERLLRQQQGQQSVRQQPNSSDQNNCAICFDRILPRNLSNRILPCGHIFHKRCIDLWLQENDNCPNCRQTVQ